MVMRRRMLEVSANHRTPILPDGYTEVEYINRGTGAGTTAGYNTTNYSIDPTATVRVEIGIMANAQQRDSYDYPIACRMNESSNSIGYGINVDKNTTTISAWNGELCTISPNNGDSIRNIKYDVVSTWSPTGISISDGVHSNSITNTPRTVSGNLIVFGLKKYNLEQISVGFLGRIYYVRIFENGTQVVNMVPCIRNSDNRPGWYDTIQDTYRGSTNYTAGPVVNY